MEPTATEVVTGDIDGDLGDPRGVPALQTRASRFRERWRDRHAQPGEGAMPVVLRWGATQRGEQKPPGEE
jgi:hypothetical protein